MSSRLPRLRSLATAALAVTVPAALAVATMAPAASARTHRPENEFRQTNLISDLSTVGAQVVDPNLKNPGGSLSARPPRCGWPTTAPASPASTP